MIPTYDDSGPGTRLAPRLRLPALLVALLLAAAGCGSAASSTTGVGGPTTAPTSTAPASPTTSTTKPAEAVPDCTQVWVAGEVLPSKYRGCMNESGKKVRARPMYCEQGNRLYLYGGKYWALANKPVHLSKHGLKNDRVFRAFVRSCTG
jgi:hypothetical protein